VTAVKDAKSDSSFFSAPKPKPKLPTFKKAPPPAKRDEHVAQPSAIDPFQEALKDMAKARRGSPAAATVPTPPVAPASAPVPGPSKLKKKGKTVTWAPEGQLELVKFIERAIYDGDTVDVGHRHFMSAWKWVANGISTSFLF
jgi:protein phosphatase 1 regulatory subunit 10